MKNISILILMIISISSSVIADSEQVYVEITPDSAHDIDDAGKEAELSSSAIIWRGLGRGLINFISAPLELIRAPYYEFTIRKWYWACATTIPAAFGGTMGRMAAGGADLITLGLYGDQPLAANFPEYFWQQEWSYEPRSPNITTIISPETIPLDLPKQDIDHETKRAKDSREATSKE